MCAYLYTRAYALFFFQDELVQVVNIGAGLDTMFFWIYVSEQI